MGCAAGLQIVPVARFSGNRWTNCQHFFGRGWCCDWIGNIGVLALRSIVPSVSFYFCPERDSVDGHENRRGGVPKGRYSTTNLSMDSFPFFKTVRLFLGSLFCVSLWIKCKFLFQYFRCVFPSFYPLFIFKMAILLSPHAFFLQTPLVGSTNICPCLTAMGDDGEWCSLSLTLSLLWVRRWIATLLNEFHYSRMAFKIQYFGCPPHESLSCSPTIFNTKITEQELCGALRWLLGIV